MFPGHVALPTPLLQSVQENRDHNIKDFLGRPSVVATGIITPTQVRGDVVQSLNLPQDLLSIPMYREKARGFLSFRATVNLRFQANAQRFQQGRLFITYFPQANVNAKKFAVVQPSLTLSTQLPRVDFDFATDSDVALTIPYVSATLGWNQATSTGEMGTYQVRIYSPLVSPGGAAAVDWTLWAWFTDVELDFPTFTSQSGMPRQAKKTTPSEMEARPISTLFKKVSAAANIFTDVPLLSSMAGTVSWVSNILGNTAAAFGFSNPDTANTTALRHMNLAHDIANVNAIGGSVSLGLLSDNKVQPLPGFAGTDVDEMSFAYLAKIPSYIQNFSWTTVQTATTSIFTKQLNITNMITSAPGNNNVIYPTPMCYIANMFKYWRTGFTFTFKFVKTEFHSGRLMLVYAPGAFAAPAFADTRFCYREILDLRESNEFTITIPYVATLPYMTMEDSIFGFGDDIGSITLYVLNPLVAPTTVSSSIDVIVEVCADDTFEVAVPRNVSYTPVMYVPGTGTPTNQIPHPGPTQFESQALGEDVQDGEKTATFMEQAPSITGLRTNDGGISAAANCIGEKIVSLRSLAKRAAPIIDSGAATNLITAFRPKIVALDNLSDTVTTAAVFALDYISMIAPLYNYQRGGLKFHAYAVNGSDTYLRAGLAPNNLGTSPILRVVAASVEVSSNNSLAIHTGPLIAGGLSFTVPQYSRTHCEMYRLYTAGSTLTTDIYCSDLRVFIRGNSVSGNTKILRQAADDWACGFFTGVMPIRISNTSNAVALATM